MPRPKGSKNKKKEFESSEDDFLAELIIGKAKWTTIAAALKETGHNNEKELEYAAAYKVLINKFTNE